MVLSSFFYSSEMETDLTKISEKKVEKKCHGLILKTLKSEMKKLKIDVENEVAGQNFFKAHKTTIAIKKIEQKIISQVVFDITGIETPAAPSKKESRVLEKEMKKMKKEVKKMAKDVTKSRRKGRTKIKEFKKKTKFAPVFRNNPGIAKIRIDSLDMPSGPDGLYLNLLKTDYTPGKQGRTWPYERSGKIGVVRAKLLQFHTNQRPAYFGTWTKKSHCLSGRYSRINEVLTKWKGSSYDLLFHFTHL